MPIREFLRTLDYTDSLEFLTMDLCIFMSVAPGSSASDIRDLEGRIKMHREVADKIAPECGFAHPALVVRDAIEQRDMEL